MKPPSLPDFIAASSTAARYLDELAQEAREALAERWYDEANDCEDERRQRYLRWYADRVIAGTI